MANDWNNLSGIVQGDITYSLRTGKFTSEYIEIKIMAYSEKWSSFDISFDYKNKSSNEWKNNSKIIASNAVKIDGNKLYGLQASKYGYENTIKWKYIDNNIVSGNYPKIKINILPKIRSYSTSKIAHIASEVYGTHWAEVLAISPDLKIVGKNQKGQWILSDTNWIYIKESIGDGWVHRKSGFSNPTHIYQKLDGNYIVSDYGNNRIVEYNDEFTALVKTFSVDSPTFFDFCENNETILVTFKESNSIKEYSWRTEYGELIWQNDFSLSSPECATYKYQQSSSIIIANTGLNQIILRNRITGFNQDLNGFKHHDASSSAVEVMSFWNPYRVFWKNNEIYVVEKTGKAQDYTAILSSSSSSSSSSAGYSSSSSQGYSSSSSEGYSSSSSSSSERYSSSSSSEGTSSSSSSSEGESSSSSSSEGTSSSSSSEGTSSSSSSEGTSSSSSSEGTSSSSSSEGTSSSSSSSEGTSSSSSSSEGTSSSSSSEGYSSSSSSEGTSSSSSSEGNSSSSSSSEGTSSSSSSEGTSSSSSSEGTSSSSSSSEGTSSSSSSSSSFAAVPQSTSSSSSSTSSIDSSSSSSSDSSNSSSSTSSIDSSSSSSDSSNSSSSTSSIDSSSSSSTSSSSSIDSSSSSSDSSHSSNSSSSTSSIDSSSSSSDSSNSSSSTSSIDSSSSSSDSSNSSSSSIDSSSSSSSRGTSSSSTSSSSSEGTSSSSSLLVYPFEEVGITSSVSHAYSLRRLSVNYTGPAIRVRRSSDNAQQDIYFTSAGNLDQTTLTTFVGANNGFITIWYDQISGTDLIQVTTTKQPQIVDAGTVYVEGSSSRAQMKTNLSSVTTGFSATLRAVESYSILRHISTNPADATAWFLSAGTDYRWLVAGDSTPGQFRFDGTTPAQDPMMDNTSGTFSGTLWNYPVSKSLTSAFIYSARRNSAQALSSTFYIARDSADANGWSGRVYELIFLSTCLNETNKIAWNNNCGTYYGITGIDANNSSSSSSNSSSSSIDSSSSSSLSSLNSESSSSSSSKDGIGYDRINIDFRVGF